MSCVLPLKVVIVHVSSPKGKVWSTTHINSQICTVEDAPLTELSSRLLQGNHGWYTTFCFCKNNGHPHPFKVFGSLARHGAASMRSWAVPLRRIRWISTVVPWQERLGSPLMECICNINIHVHVHVYVCMNVCMYVYVCICMYMYMYVYLFCVCMCMYMYVYVCICMYMKCIRE